MRPPSRRPKGRTQRLAPLLKESDDPKAYQRIQLMSLRAKYGYPSSTIANLTDYHQARVKTIPSQDLKPGERALFA